MAQRKATSLELKVDKFVLPEINPAFQKTVSYSQFSTYLTCPNKWYLQYVKRLHKAFNINMTFGTAVHATLQEYITNVYEVSGAHADRMNLEELFQTNFSEAYQADFKKAGHHFTTPQEMGEFFEDGMNILNYIRKNRSKLFTIRRRLLMGIEMPILYKVDNNLYLKGFLDVVFYDVDLEKVYIWDFKTSKSSWKDDKKKDEVKQYQLLLYKKYFSLQYDFPIENIEVKFMVLKRKIWEQSEYAQPRTQDVIPPSGTGKINKCLTTFQSFINDCFENGKYIEKQYHKEIGEASCKWCPFAGNLCNQVNA
jgi:hypothetical protein